MTFRRVSFLFTLAVALAPAAIAQVNQHLTLYGMGTQVNGTATLGDITGDINVDTSEFFDNLEIAGMAGYRLDSMKWSANFDACFFSLGKNVNDATLDLDMTVLQADGGYRVTRSTELYAGVRYTKIKAGFTSTRPITGERIDLESSEAFYDPVVGVRFNAPLSERWVVAASGDTGGWGVGMDDTWQVKGTVSYRLRKSTSMWGGYQALHQKFDDAGNNERFGMSSTYKGPIAGVTFDF